MKKILITITALLSLSVQADEQTEIKKNAYDMGYRDAITAAMYCTQYKENKTANDVYNCIGKKGFSLHKYQNAKD